MDFSGQVAVVSGAGRGLGKAYAETLACHGAQVCIAEVNAEFGNASETALHAISPSVKFFQTDVGDPASVQACVDFVIREFGCVDILVNNAGNVGLFPSLEITE
ncbi:MAG: SDR family NAD(P)-dependent oxidoreductase, partial [Chloroflexi bacterium]|nr:SDR family NAD(P)-dependent oxidoreductase [Chloroflexota bacterium]